MPNTREKLIELLADNCSYKRMRCVGCDPGKHYHPECKTERFGEIADYLIANGVTVQKWIPVTERLPEKYGEHILVCYKDGWVCDQYTPVDDGVTHWMPLPEPPKGE